MIWLYFLLTGLFIWSVTSLVDRHALSDKVKNKRLYTLLPSFVHLPMVVLITFLFGGLGGFGLNILILGLSAGLIEVLKLYFMFSAISVERISRVFPLSSLSSFIVLFLSWFLLQDPLKGNELVAFLIFVAGGSLLSVRFSEARKIELSKAVKPMLICSVLGAVEVVILKFVFSSTGFWTGLFFSRVGLFLGGLMLLASLLKGGVVDEWKSLAPKFRGLLVGNQSLAAFGHVFFYLALSLQNAALVNSMTGIQYGMIFVMASLISYWKPEILQEELDKGSLIQKAAGIVLVILAIYLL